MNRSRPTATLATILPTILAVIAVLTIAGVSVWLRWPGFVQGGFASHDVGGILYNGMVIARGGLPYVDTVELKAPGTFYLATWFAGPEARDIARFQIAANAWAVLGLLACAGCAWRCWGRLAGVVAAGLLVLMDAHLDSMDANYVTWANLPQIIAAWLALEAWRSKQSGRRVSLWMLAGAFAGFAALCKQPNGVVLLAVLAIAGLLHERASLRERALSVAWVGLGFTLAHLPIALRYLVAGQLRALIDGYVFNRWGLRYLIARDVGVFETLREGALASAHFVGLALVPAAFACGVACTRALAIWRGRVVAEPHEREQLWMFAGVFAWLLATLLAASLGARFYKGYFVAVAPPLCVLAAAPFGLLGRRCRVHWAVRVAMLLVVLALAGRARMMVEHTRSDRAQPHDLGGRRVAAHILANTSEDDTIWVWGWHLWDVYPLTGRMAGSRIYKSLGVLTQPNDDTWRRGAGRLHFVDSPYAAQLLAELDANRPAYIVLGSTVPHEEFEQLRAFLRANYRRDYRLRLGRLQCWRRAD